MASLPQPAMRPRNPAITAKQLSQASHQSPYSSRTLTTLRLTPQLRTRLANASFLTAFLFSIFTVSYLSGQSPGRLPCPARPNGTGQRAEAEQQVDGQEIEYLQPAASRAVMREAASPAEEEQNKILPSKESLYMQHQPNHESQQRQQQSAQEPRFNSFSARLAYQVSKWRQASG